MQDKAWVGSQNCYLILDQNTLFPIPFSDLRPFESVPSFTESVCKESCVQYIINIHKWQAAQQFFVWQGFHINKHCKINYVILESLSVFGLTAAKLWLFQI